MGKPRLFIGSSTEGKEIADTLQLGLDHDVEVTVWHQGVFGLSQGSLNSLVEASHSFGFAALVLTPDDVKSRRGSSSNSPRDNVIFELGLFMGALGRERTFIVCCRDESIELPTDLAGVTPATFARRSDNNLQAALGAVCTQVRHAISRSGTVTREHTRASSSPSVSDVEFRDGLYYRGHDGPFCTACYDSNGKLIRVTKLEGSFRAIGRWACNVCQGVYGS